MKRICRASGLLVLGLLSCTAPLYETAEIRKGTSWGVGVGLFDHWERASDVGAPEYHYQGASVSASLRSGLTRRFALGLQGTFFSPTLFGFESYLNGKIRLWKHGACVLGIGLPRGYSISLLQDVGNIVTFRAGGGGGPSNGSLDLALSIHPCWSERVRVHVSGIWCTFVHGTYSDNGPGACAEGVLPLAASVLNSCRG